MDKFISANGKEYNWDKIEKEHDENMESIRDSYVSIQKSSRIIMGIIILWIGIEIGKYL